MRGWLLALAFSLMSSGCQPGLGAQLAAKDFAFAFTQRDRHAIERFSTESFNKAVWERLDEQEFRRVSALLGHGEHGEVVDTQFHDNEAIIQVRTETKRQYRLYVLKQGSDWFVDDVYREKAPLEYVSMRRQAEAILAVRDFRRALEAGERTSLANASSEPFAREIWNRIDPSILRKAGAFLRLIGATDEEETKIGEVFEARDGSVAATAKGELGEHTFYFVKERGRLVVDDVSLPGSKKSLRVRLKLAIAVKDWLED
jgi:hypothetical protein